MGEEPGGHVGVKGVGSDEDVAVGAAADVNEGFGGGADGVEEMAGGSEGDEGVVVAVSDEGGAGDFGGERGGLDLIERDAGLPFEKGLQGGVKGGAEGAAQQVSALPVNDGSELVETGDDDEGVPKSGGGGGGVDGDGAAHGHAPEAGGASGEVEFGGGLGEGFEGFEGFEG